MSPFTDSAVLKLPARNEELPQIDDALTPALRALQEKWLRLAATELRGGLLAASRADRQLARRSALAQLQCCADLFRVTRARYDHVFFGRPPIADAYDLQNLLILWRARAEAVRERAVAKRTERAREARWGAARAILSCYSALEEVVQAQDGATPDPSRPAEAMEGATA